MAENQENTKSSIDIASSLEQEFANNAQAERDAVIARLRKIETAGRGSIDVRPQAIIWPLVLGFPSGMVVYLSMLPISEIHYGGVFFGAIILVPCILAMFGPHQTLFTLTEQGMRIRDALLPWNGIKDFSVVEHNFNGIKSHTIIYLQYVEGFTPPKLNRRSLFSYSSGSSKAGHYGINLTLCAGAKGMSTKKLAQRIGEFLAAARARDELARLGVN